MTKRELQKQIDDLWRAVRALQGAEPPDGFRVYEERDGGLALTRDTRPGDCAAGLDEKDCAKEGHEHKHVTDETPTVRKQ